MKVGRMRTGIILIGLGIILLLNTTGVWAWSIWEGIWRLWPVLLIAIGLEKIFGATAHLKPLAFLSPLIIIVGLAYVAIAGWSPGGGWALSWHDDWDDGSDEVEMSWSAVAQGATNANLFMDFAGGRLRLRGGAAEGNVLDGEFYSRNGNKPRLEVNVSDQVASVNLEQRRRGGLIGSKNDLRNKWTCRLSESMPFQIEIDGGATRIDADLVDIDVRRLALDIGAADVNLILGSRADQVDVEINGGAAEVRLELPMDAGVRVERSFALSNLNVSDFTLHEDGEYMVTDGYDSAPNRFDISLSGGVASFRITGYHKAKGSSI